MLKAPSLLEAMAQCVAQADTFSGPDGVGDCTSSNGNTKAAMDARHRIRDDADKGKRKPVDIGDI